MNCYVGIDVAKTHVDVYDTVTERHLRFENHRAGIRSCVERIITLHPELVVLENTGGYERDLALPK